MRQAPASKRSTINKQRRLSSGRNRVGPEILLWRLRDDVFFERFAELNDAQIRFYLGLRQSWMGRGGTAVMVEEWTPRMAEFADAAKDVQGLIDEGFIVREDALAMARRIKAEHSAGAVRATN
jgi:hypothetical protein